MNIISAIMPAISGVLSSIFPDDNKRREFEGQITQALLAHEADINKAASSVITAEAKSEHWLTANWRPLTMLIFVALIIARCFDYTAPNITEAEYLKLWSIVEFGIGGYTVCRSAEKIIPTAIKAVKNK